MKCCRDVLSRSSAQMIHIFHTFRRLSLIWGQEQRLLLNVRVMLNLSWEELRATICPIRAILGEDEARVGKLSIFIFNPSTFPKFTFDFVPSAPIDLARACIRMMTAVAAGAVPVVF